MLQGLRRFARAGFLLRELRGIHTDLTTIAAALTRLAAVFEAQNADAAPPPPQPEDPTDIAYVDDAMQAELVEIEMRLTAATGRLPSEPQIMAEYERLHDLTPGTFGGMVS